MHRLTAIRRLLHACAAAAACLVAAPAPAQRDEQQALEAVRAEIAALEQRLSRRRAERERTSRALRESELAVAAAAEALEQVRSELAAAEARGREIAAEQAAAEARLAAERDALAAQIRMSYVTGRGELAKVLLSQQDPASLGRMMVYYDYVNRARGERIARVSAELARLAALRSESEEVNRRLAALEQRRAREAAALEAGRDERRTALAALERDIERGDAEVERLRGEEARLAELVAELGRVLAPFPVNSDEPFPRLKGRLAWPVRGRIAGDYGRPRAGGLKWNGVLLEAERGAPVRAVYHGRVVFADWLAGLGLLIIVDHGDGFMSLYGHNEALLKEPGDWVAPGEPIARVGDSGGRSGPALYFEIREDGEPVNPHAWMAGDAAP
ncbi:MAG TPA: peptidoglycan DD-metalloendopeptidase family protein [Gammaproteobacteria bacterium]